MLNCQNKAILTIFCTVSFIPVANEIENEIRGGEGDESAQDHILPTIAFFVIGFWYLTFTYNGFSWSYAAGIVITLIVIVLLFIRDRKS